MSKDNAITSDKTERPSRESENADIEDKLFASGYSDKVMPKSPQATDSTPVVINLEQAKEHIPTDRPVTIEIKNFKSDSQASQLFDLLAKQNGSFEFVKPATKPGEKGYYEADAPKVDRELRVASYEGKITNAKISMPDGSTLNADEMPRGTVYDGKAFFSADPNAKGINVGDKFVPNGTAGTSEGGQIAHPGDRLIVRQQVEGGKPVLDSYPISDTRDQAHPEQPTQFEKRWSAAADGRYVPVPVPTEKTILPPNVTIKSTSEHGEVLIAPGDAYRKDGYSVKPEPLMQTWNGYTNEKAFNYLENLYKKNGLDDSPQKAALEAARARALEKTGAPDAVLSDEIADLESAKTEAKGERKGSAPGTKAAEEVAPEGAREGKGKAEGRIGKTLPWMIAAGAGLGALEAKLLHDQKEQQKTLDKNGKENHFVIFTPDIYSTK